MNQDISVFIYYQLKETAKSVAEIIKSSYSKIFLVNIKDNLFTLLNKNEHKKIVFLYAIEDIDQAQMTCFSLYKNTQREEIHQITHCDFLMCLSSNAEKAYKLCLNDVFDDYCIMQPVYDKWNFLLHIRNAVEWMELKQNLTSSEKEAKHAVSGISQLETDFENFSHRFEKIGENHKHVLQGAMQQIENSIDSFSSNISRPEIRKVLSESINNQLNDYLEILKQTTLEQQDQVEKNMETLVKQISTEIVEHRQIINKAVKPLDDKGPVMASILVADDQQIMLDIVRTILEPKGYTMYFANDGLDTLKKAVTLKPNVILMDINMPKMDGIETLKAIKLIPSLKKIPIIMLTGSRDKTHINKARNAGAFNYIIKPTKGAILLNKIRSALDSIK